jgi:hypothetical protein
MMSIVSIFKSLSYDPTLFSYFMFSFYKECVPTRTAVRVMILTLYLLGAVVMLRKFLKRLGGRGFGSWLVVRGGGCHNP